MRLPDGSTVAVSEGYIDESGGTLPRLLKLLAKERENQPKPKGSGK